jgi:hypothetical protein
MTSELSASDMIIFPPLDLARTCESLMCQFPRRGTISVYMPLWYVDFTRSQFVTNFSLRKRCMYTKSFSYSTTLVNYQTCNLCASRQLCTSRHLAGPMCSIVPLAWRSAGLTIPLRNTSAWLWRDSRFLRYALATNSSRYAYVPEEDHDD